MSNEPEAGSGGRTAAYAELITAVLDLRSSAPTRTFDQAVTEAVTDGRLSAELARELKALQRLSLRELVDHAERVLPATIVALEEALEEPPPIVDAERDPVPPPQPVQQMAQQTPQPAAHPAAQSAAQSPPAARAPAPSPAAAPAAPEPPSPPPTQTPPTQPPPTQPPPTQPPPTQTPAEPPASTPPPVDLTARRLLVAGLRTIEDRPFP